MVGFSYAARDDASIWALFMDRQFEGRGIGRRLLRLAVDWLFEQGADSVHLSTTADTRADRFYARQGWARTVLDERNATFRLHRIDAAPY